MSCPCEGRTTDADAKTVDATPATFARTSDEDRGDDLAEHGAQMERDLSRLDDDGGPVVDSQRR